MTFLSFADTKGASNLAYDALEGETYNVSGGDTWNVLKRWTDAVTSFKAILAKPASLNFLVLAFAGSVEFPDWIVDKDQAKGELPRQYLQALSLALHCNRNNPFQIHLVGHSLGGGLASYCSLKTDLWASTINPAPLVGASVGNMGRLIYESISGKRNSKITNYMAEGGEIVSSSHGFVSGSHVRVASKGNLITRHMIGNIGLGGIGNISKPKN